MNCLHLWPSGRKVLLDLVSEIPPLRFWCPELSCNYLLRSPWFSALEVTNLDQPYAVSWNFFIKLLKPKFTLVQNLINAHCSKLYFVFMLSQYFSYYILVLPTCDFPTRFWTFFLSLSLNGWFSFIIYAFTLGRSICSGYEITRLSNLPECSLINPKTTTT